MFREYFTQEFSTVASTWNPLGALKHIVPGFHSQNFFLISFAL
jgi:hypothetical protein